MQTYGTDAPVCYAPRDTRRDFNTDSGGLSLSVRCVIQLRRSAVSGFFVSVKEEDGQETDARTRNIANL